MSRPPADLDPTLIPRQPRLFFQAPLAGPTETGGDSVVKRRGSGGGTGVFFNNAELSRVALKELQSGFDSNMRNTTDDDDTDGDDASVQDADQQEEYLEDFAGFDEDLDFCSPLTPNEAMESTPMTEDIDFNRISVPENDVETLSKAVDQWKPFVNRVSKFIEKEQIPFEYVDIWVLDTESKRADAAQDSRALVIPHKSNGSHVLRHVGHATNPNTEVSSIFTMYHMNQFGDQSEKYAFQPGIGLPGRVLARGEPIWDDQLSNVQKVLDFPRTELARKHGVKKGLGIPLVLPDTMQQAILVMYTTRENMKLDHARRLVNMTYQEFQRNPASFLAPAFLMPAPDSSATATHHRPLAILDEAVGDMAVDEAPVTAASYQSILPCETEVEMAAILRDHSEDNQHPECTSMKLQCLLWRAPCRRTLQENVRLDALKQMFQTYRKEHQERDRFTGGKRLDSKSVVAKMLVMAWEKMVSSKSSNGAIEVFL